MNLAEILAFFRQNEASIASLTEVDQQTLRQSLQTDSAFTFIQRDLIANWYLVVPVEQIELLFEMGASGRSPDEINEGVTPNPLRYRFDVELQEDGSGLIKADLLTDANGYGYAFPILRTLVLKEIVPVA